MTPNPLADRLNNYADVLVATSFLLMSAMAAAVGDPDTRCDVASAEAVMISVVAAAGGLIFALILWLGRWTSRLRDQSAIEISEDERHVLRVLAAARYIFSLLFIAVSCRLILIAADSELCSATALALLF